MNPLNPEFHLNEMHTKSAMGKNIGKVFSQLTKIVVDHWNLNKWATWMHYGPSLKLINRDSKRYIFFFECH